MSDQPISPFILALPKAELHIHLEGSIEPETLVELSRRNQGPPPWQASRYAPTDCPELSLEDCRALYNYTDFTGFLMAFKAVSERLRTADDYELITYELMRKLAREGVAHAEVFVSCGIVQWRGQEFTEIFAGCERGRVRGERDFGVSLLWIIDAVRNFGAVACEKVLDQTIALREAGAASIVGIGIGGDERLGPPVLFVDMYARAKRHGLRLSAHAGETTGPDVVRETLDRLHAERLGHVLGAQQDEALLARLARERTPLELCPTSNLKTGVCPDYASHPLRRYFELGCLVTLNSDDPTMFHTSLAREYQIAQEQFAFTDAELRQLAVNSIEASWLDEARKQALLARF